jgi:hypothetical protein
MRDHFSMRTTQNTPELVMMTREEFEESMPKGRSRSKSSSAIFGLVPEEQEVDEIRPMLDMSSIWAQQQQPMHRRASTQPSQQTLMWEALRAAQLATPNDMNGVHTEELMDRYGKVGLICGRFKQEQQGRRFSVAPSVVNRFMSRYASKREREW